jgi:hypothetical protein
MWTDFQAICKIITAFCNEALALLRSINARTHEIEETNKAILDQLSKENHNGNH